MTWTINTSYLDLTKVESKKNSPCTLFGLKGNSNLI